MSEYDPQAVEGRWRDRWQQEGTYAADPSEEGDPTFVTVPYPYPSGGMHIGHARTYTVPDVYARYRRLQGDNVLFPIAWHVTGTPIIGAVERLKKREETQLSVLRDTYNVPEETLTELETPMGFARYFIDEHYKRGMRSLGLSVDWRREFTTNDERYRRFITWQYETLKERGLLENGLHPVKYCTNEHQPVTTHDLLEGEEADFQEYTLIKFTVQLADGQRAVAPMATLRPETVRGVTNAFVAPEGRYVRAQVDGETWVISETAAEKLRLQERTVETETSFDGAELVGLAAQNPVTEETVPVLPAEFVDPENATGVVMSVPAHSPDDYVALREIQERADQLAAFDLEAERVTAIEPVPVLRVEGYGAVPARDAVERAEISSQADPQLETITKELYNREFHQGEMLESYGEYGGAIVEEIREPYRDHHRDAGRFGQLYEFSEEVVCRCGGAVEVANQDTWFLRYNDDAWEEKTGRLIDELETIPENTREQYHHTVDWLNEWPCIRNYGLGTRLPWDEDFVIEPLSDSTIYMAYYTIAHRIDEVPPEALTVEFFETLFYGPTAVDSPDERALSLREEWQYWYPVDVRVSGNDLISNHLTFFLYHHAELFDQADWPAAITIMGMGLLEGQKMSSSKGHVILPGEAVDRYGADTTRLFLLNSAEPWQDFDWRADQVETLHRQLSRFWERATRIADQPVPATPDLRPIDRWLLSKLQGTIEQVTAALDAFETRSASQAVFYAFEEHLSWYRRRTDLTDPAARYTLREVLRTRVTLLAPFVPFIANELSERLTGDPARTWPTVDPALEAPALERQEELVQALTEDIYDIVEVVGESPDRVQLYVAAEWKQEVFATVTDIGPDVGQVMSAVMEDPALRSRGEAVNSLVQQLVESVRDRDEEALMALRDLDEQRLYTGAAAFLEAEFDADVTVSSETDAVGEDAVRKAEDAVPLRPAIHLE